MKKRFGLKGLAKGVGGLLLLMISAILIRVQMPSACFLCEGPPFSSLLRCGEATGYRLGSEYKIDLNAGENMDNVGGNLCRNCRGLLPENRSCRYVLLLTEGNSVKEAICLDADMELIRAGYQITVRTEGERGQLWITAAPQPLRGGSL